MTFSSRVSGRRRHLGSGWLKAKGPRAVWAVLRTVMFAGLCFMILYPVLMILTRSFMAAEDMSDSSVVLFPKHLSLDTLSLAAGMLDYRQKPGHYAGGGADGDWSADLCLPDGGVWLRAV